MRDYARMVDGKAELPIEKGTAKIEHVRYSFTSPAGGRANAETMRNVFKDPKLKERISFEVFTPEGKTMTIKNEKQLDAQA